MLPEESGWGTRIRTWAVRSRAGSSTVKLSPSGETGRRGVAEAKRRPAGGTGFLTYRRALEQPQPLSRRRHAFTARRGRMDTGGKARPMTVVSRTEV